MTDEAPAISCQYITSAFSFYITPLSKSFIWSWTRTIILFGKERECLVMGGGGGGFGWMGGLWIHPFERVDSKEIPTVVSKLHAALVPGCVCQSLRTSAVSGQPMREEEAWGGCRDFACRQQKSGSFWQKGSFNTAVLECTVLVTSLQSCGRRSRHKGWIGVPRPPSGEGTEIAF